MRRNNKKKTEQPESTLLGTDESLKLVCGWMKLNHERYKPVEQDFQHDHVEGRPERGGIGSESLSKKDVQKQTAGVQQLGGLERKILPKKQRPVETKRPANSDPPAEEDIDKSTIKRSKVETNTTDEFQSYAAVQRKKQRKKKKNKKGTTPTMSPKAAPVLLGPDD